MKDIFESDLRNKSSLENKKLSAFIYKELIRLKWKSRIKNLKIEHFQHFCPFSTDHFDQISKKNFYLFS